ncbi:MAG: DUF3467 domain-containing protein [bacterium]|nr:DUF3467 domain-containing protein [bacterium]
MIEEKKPDTNQLQVELDDQTAQGAYSNLALITHNETEFILDFIFVQPQQPKAKVRARIISSPAHIKRFLNALSDNIKKYEQQFGAIKPMVTPDDKSRMIH